MADAVALSKRWFAACVVAMLAVVAGGVVIVFKQQSRLDELSTDLERASRRLAEVEQSARQTRDAVGVVVGEIGDRRTSAESLASRVDQLERALFGVSGPSFESDVVGELESDVERLDRCVDSLLDAWNYGYTYAFC